MMLAELVPQCVFQWPSLSRCKLALPDIGKYGSKTHAATLPKTCLGQGCNVLYPVHYAKNVSVELFQMLKCDFASCYFFYN